MGVKWLVPLLLILIESHQFFVETEVMEAGDQEAVVVAFPEDIPEENCLETVKSVKKLITETSQFLYASTGMPIRKVTFLLPHLWNTDSEGWDELGGISSPTSVEKASNTHIAVEVAGLHQNGPVAVQHRNCGAQGRRVTLPVEFIHQEEKSAMKAKLLAREWIKYRYGVFDENGFPGDTRFPAYYRIPGSAEDDVKINDCANVPLNYTFQDLEGQNCSLEVNSSSGLPIDNPTCFIRLLPKENEEVTSSLMDKDLHNLPNVVTVCDDDHHLHNTNAPNKQNVFCNGQSILQVLKQHKAFKDNMKYFPSEEVEPRFRLVKQQNFRVVVAIDDTSGLENLKNLFRNSLDIFTFSLPDNSELCVLTFRNTVKEWVPLTKLNSSITYRDGLAKKINLIFRKGVAAQPEIAIEKAVEILTPTDMSQSGTIIVISSAVPLDLNPELLYKLNSLCLVVITIDEIVATAFEKFIMKHRFDSTCSKVFEVSGNNFATLKKVNEILDLVIDHNASHKQRILLKGTELNSELPLSFIVDNSIAAFDIWLTRYTTLNVEGDDFYFVNAEGNPKLNDTKLSEVMLFRVVKPTAGKWECILSFKDTILLAKVITRTKNGYPPLILNAWTELEAENDGYQQPIILYAEVFSGSYPVIGAFVKATVTSPSGNKITFQLLDNGLGDPDVTLNDGIYTRYFTQFTGVGNYKVSVTADDNEGNASVGYRSDFQTCCGSEIRYMNRRSIGMFRIIDTAIFTATHDKPRDGYEPSQVLDLRAIGTLKSSVFTLEWTAPGNEKDQKAAKEYNLKIFETKKDAYNAFDADEIQVQTFASEELIEPSLYGTPETMDIQLEDNITVDAVYYVCLRAINDKGKASKVSNVAEIFLSSQSPVGTDEPEPTSDGTSAKGSPISHSKAVGIAIGAFILVAIIIVIAYLSFYCYSKKKARRKKNNESNGDQKVNKSSKPPDETDGSVTASEWKLDNDPISPVNSVPAKVLLLHHEQVKDAKMKHINPPLFTLENLRENEIKDAEDIIREEHSPEVILQPSELQNDSNEIDRHTEKPYSKPIRRITNV